MGRLAVPPPRKIYAPPFSHLVTGAGRRGVSGALGLLVGKANAAAIDTRTSTVAVKDSVTPANNFNGTIDQAIAAGILVRAAPSPKVLRDQSGLWLSSTAIRPEYYETLGNVGWVPERSSTVLTQWSRRLDNAAWTKTNVTVAAATGTDGIVGSGSQITFTADDGTVLGTTNVSASAARRFAPFIRRVAGTDPLEWTLDGGATWTAFTGEITSTFKRFGVGVTVANPQVGFRGKNGNVFVIDRANGESLAFDTSPMDSVGSLFTRVLDNLYFDLTKLPAIADAVSLYAWAETSPAPSGNVVLELQAANRADALINIVAITAQNAYTAAGLAFASQYNITFAPYPEGTFVRIAGSSKGHPTDAAQGVFHAARDGVLGTPDTNGTFKSAAYTRLYFGSIGSNSGVHSRHVLEAAIFMEQLTDAELQ